MILCSNIFQRAHIYLHLQQKCMYFKEFTFFVSRDIYSPHKLLKLHSQMHFLNAFAVISPYCLHANLVLSDICLDSLCLCHSFDYQDFKMKAQAQKNDPGSHCNVYTVSILLWKSCSHALGHWVLQPAPCLSLKTETYFTFMVMVMTQPDPLRINTKHQMTTIWKRRSCLL